MNRLRGIPDVSRVGSYWIVSRSVLTALETCGESRFEVFPVVFRSVAGKADTTSFHILNPLDNITCMDMRASEYSLDEDGQVSEVRRLVIDEGAIGSRRHLFRIEECSYVVLVSRELGEQLRRREARGCALKKISDYED